MFHSYLKIRGITPSLVRILSLFSPSLFTVLEPIKYLAWKNEKGWERVPCWPLTQQLVWLNLHMPKKWRRASEQESFLLLGTASVRLHFLSSHLFTQHVYKNYCISPSITAVFPWQARRVLRTRLGRNSDHKPEWNGHPLRTSRQLFRRWR